MTVAGPKKKKGGGGTAPRQHPASRFGEDRENARCAARKQKPLRASASEGSTRFAGSGKKKEKKKERKEFRFFDLTSMKVDGRGGRVGKEIDVGKIAP